jgi:chloramphenicol O-acetyltransferase type B
VKRRIQRYLATLSRFLHKQEQALAYHELVEHGLLVVGRHTYGTPRVWNYQGSERKVTIGSFCSIGPNVQIITGGIHPSDWVSTYPFRIQWRMPGAYQDGMPTTRGEVVIGNDVWLGTDSVALSGVRIGDGSVVATRAVVTRDVPPYAVVAGSPARVIRYRFPPEVIERLLEIAWWNWDDDAVREAVPLLSSNNIDEFLRRYGSRAQQQGAAGVCSGRN